ncbi:MAG: flagellin lysine-N-methylase [Selenomonadaceae bacterium]|nr:flagellin lysine-N-methylase [Selenomonadaceae bacterium]
MENVATLIYPKYVEYFKCDGQRCGAKCCKNWCVDIDADTFKKYEQIESADKEITSKINYNEERKGYVIQLKANGDCPFLTEENLCSIQKNHGENFLSMVCKTYPRHNVKIGDTLEYSLSLTCPLVAELALSSDDAITLKTIKIPDEPVNYITNKIPADIQPHFPVMQLAAMVILKEMDYLTIDQRIAVLGSFWLNVDDLIKEGRADEIENLAKLFMSANFWEEYGANLFEDINFDYAKFLSIMFDCVIKNLLPPTSKKTSIILAEIMQVNVLKDFLMPKKDDSEEIATELAKSRFDEMNNLRMEFVSKMDTAFSNYVVHEIFQNLYPFCVEGSIAHNFAVMVAVYKFVELTTFVPNYKNTTLRGVINNISERSRGINNNKNCLKNLSAELTDEEDMTKIISTFLPI